jgi:hypothetical protein
MVVNSVVEVGQRVDSMLGSANGESDCKAETRGLTFAMVRRVMWDDELTNCGEGERRSEVGEMNQTGNFDKTVQLPRWQRAANTRVRCKYGE